MYRNTYIPPNKIEQIHVIDRFVENQRDKPILKHILALSVHTLKSLLYINKTPTIM